MANNVALQVGRGYDSWSAIKEASDRFKRMEQIGKPTTILHFGDFDPSGVDMPRPCGERLAELGSYPTIITISLTYDEVISGQLPRSIEPIKTKDGDSRAKAFVAKYGDIAVELDAWPPDDLSARCTAAIEQYMDMTALANVRDLEALEQDVLAERARGI